MQEKSRAEDNLAKTNEALMTFVSEMKRIKKVLFAAVGSPDESAPDNAAEAGSRQSQNMEVILKKLMKFKHLEEDNRKLKNLLK